MRKRGRERKRTVGGRAVRRNTHNAETDVQSAHESRLSEGGAIKEGPPRFLRAPPSPPLHPKQHPTPHVPSPIRAQHTSGRCARARDRGANTGAAPAPTLNGDRGRRVKTRKGAGTRPSPVHHLHTQSSNRVASGARRVWRVPKLLHSHLPSPGEAKNKVQQQRSSEQPRSDVT